LDRPVARAVSRRGTCGGKPARTYKTRGVKAPAVKVFGRNVDARRSRRPAGRVVLRARHGARLSLPSDTAGAALRDGDCTGRWKGVSCFERAEVGAALGGRRGHFGLTGFER
jgi:hypothetical protein